MPQFRQQLDQVINGLEPEFRIPVITALTACSGSVQDFEQELQAMTWDHPNLPVAELVHRLTTN